MHRGEYVDIRREDDVPPHDKLSKYKYTYDPIPLEYVPPIGKRHLMHLYSNPSCASDDRTVLFAQFPKKIQERLVVCPVKGVSVGWGIQFVEGWHWFKIWLLSFSLFGLGGLVFAVLWAVLKHDVQGAFGVAAYIMGFLATGIGTLQAGIEIS
jgi:hypothetical protein